MQNFSLRNYKHITPQERINLTLLALSRGDIKEADRLSDTCPKKNYIMMEKEYACSVMAIQSIIHTFYVECVYYYNILVKIDNSILLNELMLDPKMPQEDSVYDNMQNRRNVFISRLKAVYQGLKWFCDETGIVTDGMLEVIDVECSCFYIHKYLDCNIEANNEYSGSIRDLFLEYWRPVD